MEGKIICVCLKISEFSERKYVVTQLTQIPFLDVPISYEPGQPHRCRTPRFNRRSTMNSMAQLDEPIDAHPMPYDSVNVVTSNGPVRSVFVTARNCVASLFVLEGRVDYVGAVLSRYVWTCDRCGCYVGYYVWTFIFDI